LLFGKGTVKDRRCKWVERLYESEFQVTYLMACADGVHPDSELLFYL